MTTDRPALPFAIVAAVVAVAMMAANAWLYPETQEDAFITFRYSEHLAEGYGFGAWNTNGERVEGYTPTLWMLWLAAAPPLGMRIETLAKWTGIAAQLGLFALVFAFPWLRSASLAPPETPLGQRDAFVAAALLLALDPSLAWYTTSGMEAVPFALLVALALLLPACTRRAAPTGIVYAALVAMRPEGALFAFVFATLHALRARGSGEPLRPAAAGAIAAGAALIALTAFRLAVFGQIVPNTYFAKTAGGGDLLWRLGGVYLSGYATHHLAPLALWLAAWAALAASIVRVGAVANASLAGLLALGAGWALYVWSVGGDNPTAFPYWRQMLHASPVYAIGCGVGLVALTRNRVARCAGLAVAIAATGHQVLGAQGGRLARELRIAVERGLSLTHRPPNPYYLFIADLAEPDTVIASAAAGELPFVVDAIHIDMLGLNDVDIAHHGTFDPDGPVDSKSDVDSVLQRRPDIIQSTLPSTRFDEPSPRGNRILHRGEMAAGVLNHPIFVEEYLYLKNAPYYARDRALFLRRDFWESHPRRSELDVVPVGETAIYPSGRER